MFVDDLYWRYEPVAALGQRLDEPRIFSRVAQRFAQFVYCDAQAVIEIDCSIGAPQFVLQGFSRNHFSGMFDQDGE